MTPGTLVDRTQDALRDLILDGDLPPGSRIVESDLAERLDVGRGTIRAALPRLSLELLVRQREYRHTHVATLSHELVTEVGRVRDLLEAAVCRVAAERVDEAARHAIEEQLIRMRHAVALGDRRLTEDADWRFHAQIAAITRHRTLQVHHELLLPAARLCTRHLPPSAYRLQDVLRAHERLAAAISSGRAQVAAELGANHSAARLQPLLDALQS